jgi:polyribonucleotide nucleotidyltransferase
MKVGDKVHVEIGEIDPKGKLSLVPVLDDNAQAASSEE